MDPLGLIVNDHANIVSLCRGVLRAMPNGGVGSRERLFAQLSDEIRWHIEAEEDSLYEALEDHESAKTLLEDLEREHEEIESELRKLVRSRDKGSHRWTQRFEDFSYLLDRHFYREERELIPLARDTLDPEQTRELLHEFAEEKAEEIRDARHFSRSDFPAGWLVGALLAAAAGAFVVRSLRKEI